MNLFQMKFYSYHGFIAFYFITLLAGSLAETMTFECITFQYLSPIQNIFIFLVDLFIYLVFYVMPSTLLVIL